jgi:hypothetical protein
LWWFSVVVVEKVRTVEVRVGASGSFGGGSQRARAFAQDDGALHGVREGDMGEAIGIGDVKDINGG